MILLKTFVIGDTHGCCKTFKDLLKKANPNLEKDKLIILGDYIDRGDESWEMLKVLRLLQERFGKEHVVLLRGNHEQMAIDFILKEDSNYLYNGGKKTIESLVQNGEELDNYLEFFMGLPLFYEDEQFIFVHGGIRPGVNIASQNENDLLWMREEFYCQPNETGKTVVFGHTPTNFINGGYKPLKVHNNIAVDTGCVYGGCLSALEIHEGKIIRIYQSSARLAS